MKLKVIHFHDVNIIEKFIKRCNGNNHIQQTSYSENHQALTQICFTCKVVVTSMKKEDVQ